MSDKPTIDYRKVHHNKGKSQAELFRRATISPQQAFQIYAKLERPRSIRALRDIIVKDGHRVSHVTLANWAKKFEWRERLDEAPIGFDMDPINILANLTKESEHLTPAVIKGLQHRLAMQIARQIEVLTLDNPVDLERAVKVMADLDEAYQRHRGMAIKSNSTEEGGVSSLSALREQLKAQRNGGK